MVFLSRQYLLPRLKGNPLRVALWVDIHAAARFFSDELVKSFVANPDRGLPTYIPPLLGRAGVRLLINKHAWAYPGNANPKKYWA